MISLACPDRTFPSVGALHPPAIRFERAIHSLYGFEPLGAPDCGPGSTSAFGTSGIRSAPARRAPAVKAAYAFLPVEGESLHQIPVGPVHAGIIEPGHFRFTASGETVVRLEARLGYVHKGIESLMAGATIERAAQIARAPPATARSLTGSHSLMPSKPRLASKRRPARSICGR